MQVGCEGSDGLLRIHDESEVCDVCRNAIGNDQELQFIDAWNGAYGIPPDSVEAQRMRARAGDVPVEWLLSPIESQWHAAWEAHVVPRLSLSNAKPAISGLLVTAGERWK